MRIVAVFISCLFCSCVALAQEAVIRELDQQFTALVAEIETWKKEMTQSIASRNSVEMLLRQGVAFQKSYTAETDSIVKSDLLDEYVKKRNEMLKKLPVTLFLVYGKDSSYPFIFAFEKDDLEVDAKRPLLFQRKVGALEASTTLLAQARRRMLFSYKESQRFASLLTRFIAKAKAKEAVNVSMRDMVVSVQVADSPAGIYIQFKTPAGTVSPEMYRLTEFDAKLLADRITTLVAEEPPPAGYKEPDDLDPATALFGGTAEEPAAKGGDASPGAGGISASALSFDVARIKVSQGQKYGYAGAYVLQQFEYRISFRWGGEQQLPVQVIMYLVSTVNNKLAIVGRDVKEATLEPRRAQALLMVAEQKVPGSTAGTVIVQCFSGGRLLKSYSSSAQHKKYADMSEIESQLPPLYQNQTYIYPVTR